MINPDAIASPCHGPQANAERQRRIPVAFEFAVVHCFLHNAFDHATDGLVCFQKLITAMGRSGLPDHIGHDVLLEPEVLRMVLGKQGKSHGEAHHFVAAAKGRVRDPLEILASSSSKLRTDRHEQVFLGGEVVV